MIPPEELQGGNMRSVQRIGVTVRRTATPATSTIQRLLSHIRSKGIDWVPEPLGVDEEGREVLSYLPGRTLQDMPSWAWSESILCDVATKMRALHDATTSFDCTDAQWNFPSRQPEEVIVHHDFAPYNCVFQDETFCGLIDFDLCAPGPRLWDVAYTAYKFVPLVPSSGPEHWTRTLFDETEMLRRLDIFASAYNLQGITCSALLTTAKFRIEALAEWTRNHAKETNCEILADNAQMYAAHAIWISKLNPPTGG